MDTTVATGAAAMMGIRILLEHDVSEVYYMKHWCFLMLITNNFKKFYHKIIYFYLFMFLPINLIGVSDNVFH